LESKVFVFAFRSGALWYPMQRTSLGVASACIFAATLALAARLASPAGAGNPAVLARVSQAVSQQHLQNLVGLPSPHPAGIAPQAIAPRYYPTVPVTPSALAKNDGSPPKVEVNETDYTPGYEKQEPGDLSIYSKRAPSLWVNTGMAEAPGTTLTQQTYALNLIQPRVERDMRKLEMQFKAARLGSENFTAADGSTVIVPEPALAIHKVMQRKDEMEWTIQHWNDDCFDYSAHYVDSMPSASVMHGDDLQPCPALNKSRDTAAEETGLAPGEGYYPPRDVAPSDESEGDEAEGVGSEVAESDEGSVKGKQAKRSKTSLLESVAAGRGVLKSFKDVLINGKEYVPVFIPSGHPELAVTRLPHGIRGIRALHALHRSFSEGGSGGGDKTAVAGGAHTGSGEGGRKLANTVKSVENLVAGIMSSLSLRAPGASTAPSTAHSADGEASHGIEEGRDTPRGREQQALVKRLRRVVRQLSVIRQEGTERVPSRRQRLGQQQQQQQQQQQAAWGDYEWGQYAAAHKASPDIVAPWSQPAAAAASGAGAAPSSPPPGRPSEAEGADDYTLGNMAAMQKVAPADMRRPAPTAATGARGVDRQGQGEQGGRRVSESTSGSAYSKALQLAGGGAAQRRRAAGAPSGGQARRGPVTEGSAEGEGARRGVAQVSPAVRRQVARERRGRRGRRRRGIGGKVKRSQLDAGGEVCVCERGCVCVRARSRWL